MSFFFSSFFCWKRHHQQQQQHSCTTWSPLFFFLSRRKARITMNLVTIVVLLVFALLPTAITCFQTPSFAMMNMNNNNNNKQKSNGDPTSNNIFGTFFSSSSSSGAGRDILGSPSGGFFLGGNVATTKKMLLEAISSTDNGKSATLQQQQKVLQLVQQLETKVPPPRNLLSDPRMAKKLLDGIWYLQYTSPIKLEGMDDNDDTRMVSTTTITTTNGLRDQFPNFWKPNYISTQDGPGISMFQAKGTVSAAGITVSTSNRIVRQIFNITRNRVQNDIQFEESNSFIRQIIVGGSIRTSPTVYNRAIVAFDQAQIQLFGRSSSSSSSSTTNSIPAIIPLTTIDFSWLFPLLSKLFRKGNRDNGWLETSYIDNTIRIGRGDKGTLFILTRDSTLL